MDELDESGPIEEDVRTTIEKELRFLWLMWAGCLSTVPTLLLVSMTIGRRVREDIMAGGDVLPRDVLSIFLIMGFAFPVAAYFLRKDLLAGRLRGFQKTEITSRTNKPVYLVRYRVGAYLAMVTSTAPGICGFSVYVFGGHAAIFYLLLGVAVLSILYYRPKRAELVAMIRRDKAKDGAL